ncbi:MAG: substrate-binding domain-containing protein [Anaerolineae bacterium]|nr:substrate-binding domain-containing protein [Anaerolineae bacterium]
MSAKTRKGSVSRRNFLRMGGAAALGATAASMFGLPVTAFAQGGKFGKPRKVIWVPQATGDWNVPMRVGHRDFCAMVGWEYQHIGDPVYSVERHVEQVNQAIAAKADVIITELENVGLVPVFKKAMAAGITMVITDQGIEEEAAKLKLNIINQDEYVNGLINGTQAATWAQKLTNKKEGMIVLGNGNPGATSIDRRQAGTKQSIEDYNKKNGTNFQFEAYADSEFDDEAQSIQKWTAQIQQKGDSLVAIVGTGNVVPLAKAAQEAGLKPGQVAIGSTDAPPGHQALIEQGWVQWGIDNQFYPMGFYTMAAAWVQLERGYPYPTIKVGTDLILKEDLERIRAATKIWQDLAKQYGDIK